MSSYGIATTLCCHLEIKLGDILVLLLIIKSYRKQLLAFGVMVRGMGGGLQKDCNYDKRRMKINYRYYVHFFHRRFYPAFDFM